MLTAFTVENYRSFVDRTRIELRPLTLLFGYNNAGKSALVRALPLIADSMKPDVGGPLALNLYSEAVRGSIFFELVSKLGDAKAIRFGLELGDGLQVEYEITRPGGSILHSLSWVSMSHPADGAVTLELVPETRKQYRLLRDGKSTIVEDPFTEPRDATEAAYRLAGDKGARAFLGADIESPEEEAAREAFRRLRRRLLSASLDIARETFWLGSVRRYPERFVRVREGGALPRLRYDGSEVAHILAFDRLLGDGCLLTEVSAWYEREDTYKSRLRVVQSPDDQFSLVLEQIGDKGRVPIAVADTGEGVAQVLPVLLATTLAGRRAEGDPRLLAFEEPESHLHPSLHAPLAEHLSKLAATDDPPRMLIETHSENFLLGVQLQVARKLLSPDRVLIYWVYQSEDGSSLVQRIELDEEGYAQGFPDDVFDKDVELSRLLIRARERVAA
jgi:hypothetical protein